MSFSVVYRFAWGLSIRVNTKVLFPRTLRERGEKGWAREGESLGEEVFFWVCVFFLLGFSFFLLTKHIHFELLPMLDSFLPCPQPYTVK